MRHQQLPPARGYASRCQDRTGYVTPLGKLPSVSTIIGATKSEEAKAALEAWKQRQGSEAMRMAAARRGTWVHSMAEAWITRNDDLPAPTLEPTYLPGLQRAAWGEYWRSLEGWLNTNFHSSLAIEKPIWHGAGFSGTFDCLGWTYDSTEVALLDWKTRGSNSKPLNPEGEQMQGYFMQLAAYRAGVAWTYGVDVTHAHLVVATAGQPGYSVHLQAAELDLWEQEFFARLKQFQQLQNQEEGHVVA